MTTPPHSFEDSSLGQSRKLLGPRTLISPGARTIMQEKQGDVLLVRRSDHGTWSMSAGSMKLTESILNCLN